MADSSLDRARETQLRNIEARTGTKLAEFRSIIAASGLTKHGEIRSMLMERFGLGHGDANGLVHYALASDGQSKAAGASTEDILAGIYTGAKAPLRSVHDTIIAAIDGLGEYETVPKKGYVSLRRRKQFAMVGPATRGKVEVGLNMKGIPPGDRLEQLPPGGMCQYRVRLESAAEVDAELLGWVRTAYEGAG